MSSDKETRPAGNGTGIENSGQATNPLQSMRPRCTKVAAAYISRVVDELMTGSLGLHEIVPELADVYWLGELHGYERGYRAGRATYRERLERAEADRDTYYERWTNPDPRKLTEVRQRRMDEALAAFDEREGRIPSWDEQVALMVDAARPEAVV
ncbi:hypothetical protein M3D15_01020 [Pseudoclavibacter alba]|uniref:Uncharacterized protein n=1 Tax=Pseudoclavibacter albus TaxID=272241 RepID=A0ABT2HUD0_9MICO|nr:hypothetical protein [Pseudoclavibacter alba]MCT2041928.1 hypothetical protein [Pseudoclavibacter alba]